MAKTETSPALTQKIETIARTYLGIETLACRDWDRLDNHEVHVVSVKNALQAAYRAGVEELLAKVEKFLEDHAEEMAGQDDYRALLQATLDARQIKIPTPPTF